MHIRWYFNIQSLGEFRRIAIDYNHEHVENELLPTNRRCLILGVLTTQSAPRFRGEKLTLQQKFIVRVDVPLMRSQSPPM